jgi:mono/diheme cytochrome c family protein
MVPRVSRPPRHLVLILVVLGAAACYPKGNANPPALPQGADPQVTQGRELFVAKCNGCHQYPELTAIDEKDIPSIVKRMGGKANLDDKQTAAVESYVRAGRGASAPAAAK